MPHRMLNACSKVVVPVVAAIVTLAALSSRGEAQSAQPWSIQGSVMLANQEVNGSAIGGVGFEGQLRYSPSAWSFGVGYQTSTHDRSPESLTLSGVFFEPRYAVDVGSDRFAPYVAGRVALLTERSRLKVGTTVADFSSSGTAFGAGAGLLTRLSSSVNLDVGAALVSQSFADAKNTLGTARFKSFLGYVAKVGISVGF